MKAKLSAGAELDILTKDELSSALDSFRSSLQNRKSFRWLVSGGVNLTAGSALTLWGPETGYEWALTRISLNASPPNNKLWIYKNDQTVQANILTSLVQGFNGWNHRQIILKGGDTLVLWNSDTNPLSIQGISATVEESKVC